MKKKYSRQHHVTEFNIGDVVLFGIPKKLRRSTEVYRIPGRIHKIRNHGYFEVRTQYGIVKELFLGNELVKPLETYDARLDMSVSTILPLSAVVKAHLTTARPTCCGCRRGCSDQRCSCRKGNIECSSYCHRGGPCTNRPTEDSPGEPLARAHRRLASTQINSQTKRARRGTLPQSSTQPQSTIVDEEGNQLSPQAKGKDNGGSKVGAARRGPGRGRAKPN